jgi:hypothetical protein
MIKRQICLLFAFACLGLHAQQWEGFYSYNDITGIAPSDNGLIYVSAENALFSYDPQYGELQTWTTVDGLLGDEISALFVNENRLFVGYYNGMLGVYDLSSGAYHLDSGIERNQTIPEDKKTINHFQIHDGKLYLSTEYGISAYDPENKVFRDTYYLGPNYSQISVNQTAVQGSNLYAATEIGLYMVNLNDPLVVQTENWTQVASGNWVGIGIIDEKLIGVTSTASETQFRTIDQPLISKNISGKLISLNFYEDQLTLCFSNKIINVDKTLESTQVSSAEDLSWGTFTSAVLIDEKVYLGTSSNGLIQLSGGEGAIVSPQGPLRNDAFHVALQEDNLWIAHGNFSGSYNPHPLNSYGISQQVDNQWQNIPYENVFGAKSLGRVVPDPNSPNVVYVCSFHSGLLEITDGIPKTLWDHTNSGLEVLDNDKFQNVPASYRTLRLRDIGFDSKGNMWSITALVERGLKKRTPSGGWESINLLPLIDIVSNGLGYSNLIISQNDEVFFGSIVSGLIGYKESNGVATLKGLDTQNNLPTNDVRSLAIDLDGHLWIGTREGLRVLYNASRMFENQEVQAREIIVDQGGNLGELLKNQFITDIKVNGNNQKWVATADSGVFMFSPDGTETLHHFTKENSPLPSNSIRNITVNNQDGKVYFGTANGMVSFQGSAFSARENFDQVEVYPNPVRPEFKGRLTIRGLQKDSTIKITDISGHLVHETESQGGSIQWDLKNLQGNRVRTGVYLIFVSDREGIESTVEKVMIVN